MWLTGGSYSARHRRCLPARGAARKDFSVTCLVNAAQLCGSPSLKELLLLTYFSLCTLLLPRQRWQVFLEANYGPSIDVWSAGCIMAEMLQRKPLFMGSNTAQMLRMVVQFCGKPSQSDLSFVTNKKVCTLL